MGDLFDSPADTGDPGVRADPNPMYRLFGPGPKGVLCGACVHIQRSSQGSTWSKCALRRNTGGKATDHRVRWRACAKFEASRG